MTSKIKFLNFKRIPVYLDIWFLVLFFLLSPVLVVSIFISILLHEIAHAWMANRYGYKVDSIEIGLFIGQANMNIDSINDKDMIVIAGAGPWINLIIFLIMPFFNMIFPCVFFNSMFTVNLFLFIFNIIPIFPLDGGRIFRSLLILKTDDVNKSIKISCWVSLIFVLVLIIFNLISFNIFGLIFSIFLLIIPVKELASIKR